MTKRAAVIIADIVENIILLGDDHWTPPTGSTITILADAERCDIGWTIAPVGGSSRFTPPQELPPNE